MPMMKSIQAKLILAMLLKSLIVIVVVGTVARLVMLNQFNNVVVSRAIDGFIEDAAAYYTTYGSWEAGSQQQSFLEFIDGRRQLNGPRNNLLPDGQRPRPLVRPDGQRLAPEGIRPLQGQGRAGTPPSFVVADEDGVALVALGGQEVGDQLTSSQMRGAQPIQIGDQTIGYAVQLLRPELTDLETQYLKAHNNAWLYSLSLAIVLAIPAGIFVASYFSRPVHELTLALKAMKNGAYRQSVQVRSKDEFGQLASSFNTMSENLATAYEELERSKAKLTTQAELLRELSRTDELTRLLNRRAFDEQAKTLQAQAERHDRNLTYAILDLDRFKQVNDQFSHSVGDQVLRIFSKMLMDCIRTEDVAARYGGDEFVVAFPETDVNGAARIAKRLRKLVADYDWSEVAEGLSVTISIGLGAWTYGKSLESALHIADEKLYEAKNGGRNQVAA